ncbi:hypothetical protein A8F94_09130 [Bacillus sp. FJAT-27225]|nr:hypothetical protein A8F94_09130 [Bacillus sp. FJAT-27225]
MHCVLAAFLLTGCVQKEIIDDVSLVTGIGYDAAKNGKIEGTALMPFYLPDQKVENNTITAVGSPTRDLFRLYQQSSSDPVVGGSLEVALFGKDFAAKHGVYQVLDSLQRDPGVGSNAFFAIADGKAKDLLNGKFGKKGNASYISDLIKHNSKNRDLPRTNMHLFLSDYFKTGKSAYLPILKLKGKNHVKIAGIGVFKDDKLVYSIPEKDLFYFKLLVEKYSEGTIKVVTGKQEAVVESLSSEYKRKLVKRNPYELTVDIEVKGLIHQYTGRNMDKKIVNDIKRALKGQIESECTDLIKQFQKEKIDPIGLTHFVKTKTRGFDYEGWKKNDYNNMKVTVNAKVNIYETGVIQ